MRDTGHHAPAGHRAQIRHWTEFLDRDVGDTAGAGRRLRRSKKGWLGVFVDRIKYKNRHHHSQPTISIKVKTYLYIRAIERGEGRGIPAWLSQPKPGEGFRWEGLILHGVWGKPKQNAKQINPLEFLKIFENNLYMPLTECVVCAECPDCSPKRRSE